MTRPFDLEAAKRGEPILCGGRPVAWGAYFPSALEGLRVVIINGNGYPCTYRDDGTRADGCEPLTMAPRKVTLWANVYKSDDGEYRGYLHSSKEAADECSSSCIVIRASPVEIEI